MEVLLLSVFSCRLTALRKALGVRQTEAASAASVSVRAYQYYESATKEPTLSVIAALSDFFDVPADFLLGLKPFEHWEALQPHMDDLRAQTAKIFDLPPALVANASLPEFIRLFGALYARAEISPSDGSVALYPLLPPRS